MPADRHLEARLGLLDATALVAGSMIGSGIFIVSADIARRLPAAGWLLAVWAATGLLTVAAAASYGRLAAAMPRAGGQYAYLVELWGPVWGFLFGWTLVLVIQTGTIAAVAGGGGGRGAPRPPPPPPHDRSCSMYARAWWLASRMSVS